MTGSVKHVQHAVAEVDPVAVIEEAGRFTAWDAGSCDVKLRWRRMCGEKFRSEPRAIVVKARTAAQVVCLGGVDQDPLETVAVADVVPVGMRVQDDWLLVRMGSN